MNTDVWCDPRAGEIAAPARAFGAIPALSSHPNVGTILGDLIADRLETGDIMFGARP